MRRVAMALPRNERKTIIHTCRSPSSLKNSVQRSGPFGPGGSLCVALATEGKEGLTKRQTRGSRESAPPLVMPFAQRGDDTEGERMRGRDKSVGAKPKARRKGGSVSGCRNRGRRETHTQLETAKLVAAIAG
jgi:hypothetical protein